MLITRFSHNLKKNPYLLYQTNNINFIDFSKKEFDIDPPLPLRRVFSLVRLMECDFFLCETIDCNLSQSSKNCERAESCRNFIDILTKDNVYNAVILSRACYKISFYKTSKEEIELSLDNILQSQVEVFGFAMIHVDTFEFQKNGKKCIESRSNLPICFFKPPFPYNYFTTPLLKGILSIDTGCLKSDKEFIGQYFSEQNKITNCCAHASIKSALHPCLPKISSKMINKAIDRNHITARGHEGLSPSEIKTVVKSVTEDQLTITFVKYEKMDSSGAFWQTVYHSLESRFPVVLLLRPLSNNVEAHAVTLLGHSLNVHNWWSYGTKGEFGLNVDEHFFFSSSLWCSNFIINDDLIGPHYCLPIKFKKNYSVNSFMRKFQQLKRKFRPLSNALYEPIYSLMVLPQEVEPYWDLIYSGEYHAIDWLYMFIRKEKNIKTSQIYSLIESQNSLFTNYFYNYFKSKSLITRIICVRKEEYINSITTHNHVLKNIEKTIINLIPPFIWVVEISIPELFWINKEKVGEIVLNPLNSNSIILCHLPNLVIIQNQEKNGMDIYIENQKDRHYKMIQPYGIYNKIIEGIE